MRGQKGNRHNERGGEKFSVVFGGRGDRIMSNLVRSVSMRRDPDNAFILGFLVTNGMPVLRESTLSEIFLSRLVSGRSHSALGMLYMPELCLQHLSSLIALPIAVALAIFTAEWQSCSGVF